MAKHILKKTERDCVVKISGPSGTSETITLDSDLLTDREELDPNHPQVVWITGLTWTGNLDSVGIVSRNGVVIASMQANTTGQFDFEGQGMVPDSVNAQDDLTVAITDAQGEYWIRLRKVSGYLSKHEAAIYGSYDDPSQVGA